MTTFTFEFQSYIIFYPSKVKIDRTLSRVISYMELFHRLSLTISLGGLAFVAFYNFYYIDIDKTILNFKYRTYSFVIIDLSGTSVLPR